MRLGVIILFSIFISFGIIWLIDQSIGFPRDIWGTILTLVILAGVASFVTNIMSQKSEK